MIGRMVNTRTLGKLLVLLLAGCDITQQERVRLYNEDGVHQFSQGNYREAADSFEQALLLSPNDPVLVYNVAQSYDRAGNVAQAEKYYIECLRHDGAYADARQSYANLLARTSRSDHVSKLIEEWSKQEGSQADTLTLQAWKLRQENRYPEAYETLQKSLAKEPHNPRTLTELAILYEKMNYPERSLVLYERVLATSPNNSEVRDRVVSLKAKGLGRPLLDQ